MRFKKFINEIKIPKVEDFNAVVAMNQLEKYQKDLKILTKSYKNLPYEKEWEISSFHWEEQTKKKFQKAISLYEKLRKAFNIYSKNFEKWVYGTLIRGRSKEIGKDSYAESVLRTSAWNFVINFGGIDTFPSSHGRGMSDVDIQRMTPDFRQKAILKYQRQFRQAVKDAIYLIQTEGDKIKLLKKAEQFNLGGVNIYLTGYARGEKWYEKYLDKFFKQLKPIINLVKSKGFGKSIEGLTIVIAFDKENLPDWVSLPDLTAAYYSPKEDMVGVLTLGLSDKIEDNSLIHELGHRFYYRGLTSNARASWDKIIDSRKLVITKDDVDEYMNMYFDKENDKWHHRFEDDMMNSIKKTIKDDEKKAKFLHIAQYRPAYDPKDGKTKYQAYLDRLMKEYNGESVNGEFISQYGSTNPREAFAEVFSDYVGKGPRAVGEWTREFFKDVVSTAGVRLKENKDMELYEKYLKEAKDKKLFELGRKVNYELANMHVTGLKPKDSDFKMVADKLGITKKIAMKAWNEFTWG